MIIKYEIDNDCVGCPQGCIHCGKGEYSIPLSIECEICGEDSYEIYQDDDGINMCMSCLLEQFKKITVDDIAEDSTAYEDEQWEKV